ncbi:MAG: hypothetical protein GWP15_01710 [Nitrospirae bacterium]|nr:hypothetical protein [Nitrospirota bacterium]
MLIPAITMCVSMFAGGFTLEAKMYSLAAMSAVLVVVSVILLGAGLVVRAVEEKKFVVTVTIKDGKVVEEKEGEAEPRVDGFID